MILATIFDKLFKDMTLTYKEYKSNLIDFKEVTKTVQYGYGDLKELNKWIRGRSGKEKYPLIWFIIESRGSGSTDYVKSNVTFYLFTSTKTSYYNNTRAEINYSNILDPLSTQIYELILSNGSISYIYNDYEKIINTFDIPDFGLDFDDRDFVRKEEKGQKSVAIDIVDARKLDFQARFNKNCLI